MPVNWGASGATRTRDGWHPTCDPACALRTVISTNGMTAAFLPFPMDFLGRVSRCIIDEARGIKRVGYDVTSKPPGIIEWE